MSDPMIDSIGSLDGLVIVSRVCVGFVLIPDGVIGNTRVFGTRIPGSSPGRVDGIKVGADVNWYSIWMSGYFVEGIFWYG